MFCPVTELRQTMSALPSPFRSRTAAISQLVSAIAVIAPCELTLVPLNCHSRFPPVVPFRQTMPAARFHGGAAAVVKDHVGPVVLPLTLRATICQKYVVP